MTLLMFLCLVVAFFWVRNNWNNASLFQARHPKQVVPSSTSARLSTDSQGEQVVLSFADENNRELVSLSVIELASHVAIIGASGSGKTSTILKITLESLMRLNLPGVIFAAKVDDVHFIQKLAKDAGRELSLIDKTTDSHRLNFLQYLLKLKGETSSIVEVLFNLPALLNKSVGSNTGEQFWNNSGRMLLKSTLDLIYLVGYPVTMDAITSVLTGIPRTEEDLSDPVFIKSSLCVQLLLLADELEKTADGELLTPDQRHNLRTACHFFKQKYLNIPEVTRGSIGAVLDALLFYLNDGTIRRLFFSDSSFTPEECFIEGGRTVFVNFPVTLGQFEKFASGLFREVMKQAVIARDITRYPSFMYLYADEYQALALSTDAEFWGVCRSQKAINIIATQSFDSIAESLGAGETGRQKANIILGNCAVHCYLKSRYETAKWIAESIGREYKTLVNTSSGRSTNDGSSTGNNQHSTNNSNGKTSGYSTTTQRDYIIFPEEIMQLKTGGFANNYQVEMYLMPGKVIAATQTNFLKITLDQDLD